MTNPDTTPDRCPLCGGPNRCAVAAGTAPRACWCMTAGDIPADLRDEADRRGGDERCVCEACIAHYRHTGQFRRMVA